MVKIARALFEYMDSQTDIKQFDRLDPLYEEFERLANDYHNQTGGLHPDLGFQLTTWASFKLEALAPNPSQQFAEGMQAPYETVIRDIINELEDELGL